MKPKTSGQHTGKKAGSAPQNTATHSGSRPMSGKYPLQSTAPKVAQRIRG